MIKNFNIDDITDVFIFDENGYNHNFLKLLDNIKEEDLNKTFFDITIIDGKTITTKITDIDIPLTITFKVSKDICEYPLYFIKSIKRNIS